MNSTGFVANKACFIKHDIIKSIRFWNEPLFMTRIKNSEVKFKAGQNLLLLCTLFLRVLQVFLIKWHIQI